jgi:O-antigen/teichoic acid export membrane protein
MGSLVRTSAFTFIGKLAISALSLLNSVLLARLNSNLDFGHYQSSASYSSVPTTYMGGYAGYYSYALAKSSSDYIRIMQMGNLFVYGVSLVFLGITVSLRTVLFSHLNPVWWWACLAIPFAIAYNYGTKLLQGFGQVSRLNYANILQPLLLTILATVVVLNRHSFTANQRLYLTYTIWIASVIGGALFTVVAVYKVSRDRRALKWRFHATEWRGTVRYGTWLSLSNTVNAVNYRTDFWFVSGLFPLLASQYAIAVTASEVLLQVSGSLATVVFKSMTHASREDSIRITETVTRHTLISSVVVAIPMLVAVPWVISTFYGARYAGAIVPFLILLPGLVFKSAGNIVIQFATNQLGSPKHSIWMNGVSAFINAALCIAFVPHFGIVGAAGASTASYVISFAIYTFWFSRYNHISPNGLFLVQKRDLFQYTKTMRRLASKLQ